MKTKRPDMFVRFKCESCGTIEDVDTSHWGRKPIIHPPSCHKCKRSMIEIDVMMKVRVYVKIVKHIPYIVTIHQEDRGWNERIREALLNKDSSDWETDPDFYEYLGSNWSELVAKTKNFDAEIIEPKPAKALT